MQQLKLCRVSKEILTQIKAIDDACLGGLWSLQAYEQEIANPKSTLIALIADHQSGVGLWLPVASAGRITYYNFGGATRLAGTRG
jgi:hypothetical protein